MNNACQETIDQNHEPIKIEIEEKERKYIYAN